MLSADDAIKWGSFLGLGSLLAWIAKKAYARAVGKWRAGKAWVTSMNAAKAELAGLKTTISEAFNPEHPSGIQACFRAVNEKIDAVAGKLTQAIAVVSDKVSVNFALRTIELDRISEPVVTFCRELRLTFANKAALRVLGASALEEVRGHAWKDKLVFNTIERAEVAMQKAAADFRPCTISAVIRGTKTDGRSIQFCLEPVISEKNEFSGFTGVVVDLERRHQKARGFSETSPI